MSTLSENAACIRETTPASTTTSHRSATSLASLDHLFTKKTLFWRNSIQAKPPFWKIDFSFVKSTSPNNQFKHEQHCSPFTSRRVSWEAWTRLVVILIQLSKIVGFLISLIYCFRFDRKILPITVNFDTWLSKYFFSSSDYQKTLTFINL